MPDGASAVIVGAGPAGYCSAIVLARCGFQSVHILERCSSADYHTASKAYSYVLFPFAKDAMREVLGLESVESAGVISSPCLVCCQH